MTKQDQNFELIMEDRDIWEPLLDEAEQLNWTGRPDDGWHFRRNDWVAIVIAVLLAGVAVLAVYAGIKGDAPWWFLALFVAAGILGFGIVLFGMLRQRSIRSTTRYALTDRRVLVLVLGNPNKLWGYEIAETNRLDLAKYGEFSIVFFRDEYLKLGDKVVERHSPVEIGFEFISDGENVYEQFRSLGAGNGPSFPTLTKASSV